MIALDQSRLELFWSDGTVADVDISDSLNHPAFACLRDADEFSTVQVGDWGHSIAWRCGIDMGADTLWRASLAATGDVRQFLDWRLRNGLSLTKAAAALGLARRTIAYYSTGERSIPKSILLACTGWEVQTGLRQAA
ncbi:MAG: hypothetical protein RL367_2547 [Pseudomonadota bacterium]